MSVQTLPIAPSEKIAARPFVVVTGTQSLIGWHDGYHLRAQWERTIIDRLHMRLVNELGGRISVDVGVAVPVAYSKVVDALYPDAWLDYAGKIVVHGLHSPCGDLQQHEILPHGHNILRLPTIEVVSMSYTDSLSISRYSEACNTAFQNIGNGRKVMRTIEMY